MDLKTRLANLKPAVACSPWAGYEHVLGYGVFGLPLTSGHVLALRVFPVNDFAPYVTVWHRDPAGAWAIYYDAPRPDIACPRYYASATQRVQAARIAVTWEGPTELRVAMDGPALDWSLGLEEPRVLSVLNWISVRLPFWTWQHALCLKPREWIARWLGLGRLHLAGVMPSGHVGVLMPQELYFVARSHAVLGGVDLGAPSRVRINPTI